MPTGSEICGGGTLPVAGIGVVRETRAGLARRLVADWQAARRMSGEPPGRFPELAVPELAVPELVLPKLVFSINGQAVSLYHSNEDFRRVYDTADIIHADGMSIIFASRLLSDRPLPERIATTDFFHDAAREAELHGMSFYMLGGTPVMLENALAQVRTLYPGLRIAGSHHGYFQEGEAEEAVLADIVAARPDVLWVGLGRPRQEEFCLRYRQRLAGVVWLKTCGGLFDFLAGRSRAPQWMQDRGLEWAYRMVQEPRRLAWRYVTTNVHATWCVMRHSLPAGTGPGKDGALSGMPAPRLPVLGVAIDPVPGVAAAAGLIDRRLAEPAGHAFLVSFCCPATLALAWRDPAFREGLGRFDLVLPETLGVVKAIQVLHGRHTPRISFDTRSLALPVLESIRSRQAPVMIVCGDEMAAVRAAGTLAVHLPGLRIVACRAAGDDLDALAREVCERNPAVVLCADDEPRQTRILTTLADHGWTGCGIACGDALSQMSQRFHYYPKYIDAANLRWAYRIMKNPKTIGQDYLASYPLFFTLTLLSLLRDRQVSFR